MICISTAGEHTVFEKGVFACSVVVGICKQRGGFMHRTVKAAALACAAMATVALPAAANARTKTVYAGAPPTAPKLIQTIASVNDFFLHKVTVNVGDKVKFVNMGFHNVDFPGASGKDLPLIAPGSTVTGVNDAAGSPFWFNGKVPALGFNPAAIQPAGGTSYDGSKRVDSGLPLGPPKPFTVTFTKAGSYKYFCDVHPGMVGSVNVLAKGKPVPSATADTATLKSQVKGANTTAQGLTTTKLAANTVSLGVAGPRGVEIYAMVPTTLRVKPGTVVNFTMSKGSREDHTATFGPKAYLKKLASSFTSPSFAQEGLYPSAPSQPITLDPTTHGNGFANTGFLDQDPLTPLPAAAKIQFTKAGTYRYICVIHPLMSGTVIVQ
jgi:plastocyanin